MIQAVMVSGKPDEKKRSCFDCYYCQAAVSWWCTNEDASKKHGTKIPGGINCKFWKPVRCWDELKWYEKLFGDFIKIESDEL